jgi:ribosomal protein S12 methylthiotransferase accessory factor
MEMEITFPGGARVDANFGGFTIATDQPPAASAPTPFATFLASIGTCAGIYVLSFCRQRGIPADDIKIVQRMHADRMTGLVGQIDLDIQLPPDFPEKYAAAVIRSAEQCAVKKHLEHPPMFNVVTSIAEPVMA